VSAVTSRLVANAALMLVTGFGMRRQASKPWSDCRNQWQEADDDDEKKKQEQVAARTGDPYGSPVRPRGFSFLDWLLKVRCSRLRPSW
jgi:hypothetical protein